MRTITLPRPHARQRDVIVGAKRFNVLCCGRRWGKTMLGMDRIIQPALHGKPCAWFAPHYKHAAPAWRELQNLLQPVITRVSQQERRLDLIGGGSLEVWSLDLPDAGRGRAYAAVVIDEAALIQNLENAWQESIRPQLTDYRGSAWFLSTPKGTANYFHALYSRGKSEPDWASWQMPTSTNPFMAESEIQAARLDLTDLAFAQEYAAEFVSWAGQVFRRITDAIMPPPPEHTPAAIIGVDWGRTNDYTVFMALSKEGAILEIERFRGVEYSLQRARLRALWERRGARAHIIAEQNNMGGPVIEQLQRDGLPVISFLTTNATKSAIVEALALAFERGTIRIPNDPVLVGELQAFEAKPLPSGLMRYAAPEGMHDDCVMSLAIGWSGIAEAGEAGPRRLYLDPNTGGLSDQPHHYVISPY